ncbi:hypothetical protein GCM10025865_26490 [Paraoerskovia sediminicola]|uniref:Transcobalamin-like C-terminal domain-containing protein n=1 Tax=Paraoerskovia sediminicola TaxID=1138587 RepID=A0ABM8G568_9CELL|nr:DUF4430 domain-containing protein [Paraoerskovia sediminicola]BDZ43350.1 hypothetical protein GCM10025865_26490 [Paraoerskovia sediminicola]
MTTRTTSLTLRDATTRGRAAALASAVLVVGLLAGCAGDDTEAGADAASAAPEVSATDGADPAATSEATDAPDAADAVEFAYTGRTGSTALELLLEADPTAEVTGEGENAYVTAIDGQAADDAANEFWALYVNDEFAQVGAGVLETEDGDEIVWKLDTF